MLSQRPVIVHSPARHEAERSSLGAKPEAHEGVHEDPEEVVVPQVPGAPFGKTGGGQDFGEQDPVVVHSPVAQEAVRVPV